MWNHNNTGVIVKYMLDSIAVSIEVLVLKANSYLPIKMNNKNKCTN